MRIAKRCAMSAAMCAVAIIFSYVEALIPLPLPLPGFKLGLANIAIVCSLYAFSLSDTLLIATARSVIVALLFGGVNTLMFSLVGGTLAIVTMHLLKRSGHFSIFGVSVAGATAHNLGQIIVAAVLTSSLSVAAYLPFLMVCSLITGLLIGLTAGIAIKRLPFLKKP